MVDVQERAPPGRFLKFGPLKCNRPFAAKPSRDLLFITLWAATLRMPEMEKACRKHQNCHIIEAPGVKK